MRSKAHQDPVGLLDLDQVTNLPKVSEIGTPFFQDVVERDGNQALKKPFDAKKKIRVFELLQLLGVQGAEIGFPGSSEMDFDAFCEVAATVKNPMMISALARTHPQDIMSACRALKYVPEIATPCLHTFIAMSPFNMQHQLGKSREEVREMAVNNVMLARDTLPERALIQFSPEHFGDCLENLNWVIEVFLELYEFGVRIFNLPTTVERTRPSVYAHQVSRVKAALPSDAIISTHCHNDLGMGTATTVEGFYAGANQLEVTLNGLGERAGNTSLYEVAMALYCNGVDVPLNLGAIQEVALEMEAISGVAIPEKAPVIGRDCNKQRSGIHQNGAVQTFGLAKQTYLPFNPAVVGRAGEQDIEFTSQSGYTAVMTLLRDAGHNVSKDEARLLQPAFKKVAEKRGALSSEQLVEGYKAFVAFRQRVDDVTQDQVNAIVADAVGLLAKRTWKCVDFLTMSNTLMSSAAVILEQDGARFKAQADVGDGQVDAIFSAIRNVTGVEAEVVQDGYNIAVIGQGSAAPGKAEVKLRLNGYTATGEGTDVNVIYASVKAYIAALNDLILQNDRDKALDA